MIIYHDSGLAPTTPRIQPDARCFWFRNISPWSLPCVVLNRLYVANKGQFIRGYRPREPARIHAGGALPARTPYSGSGPCAPRRNPTARREPVFAPDAKRIPGIQATVRSPVPSRCAREKPQQPRDAVSSAGVGRSGPVARSDAARAGLFIVPPVSPPASRAGLSLPGLGGRAHPCARLGLACGAPRGAVRAVPRGGLAVVAGGAGFGGVLWLLLVVFGGFGWFGGFGRCFRWCGWRGGAAWRGCRGAWRWRRGGCGRRRWWRGCGRGAAVASGWSGSAASAGSRFDLRGGPSGLPFLMPRLRPRDAQFRRHAYGHGKPRRCAPSSLRSTRRSWGLAGLRSLRYGRKLPSLRSLSPFPAPSARKLRCGRRAPTFPARSLAPPPLAAPAETPSPKTPRLASHGTRYRGPTPKPSATGRRATGQLPRRSVQALAVPDLRQRITRRYFMAGFEAMVETLNPSRLRFYGQLPMATEIPCTEVKPDGLRLRKMT